MAAPQQSKGRWFDSCSSDFFILISIIQFSLTIQTMDDLLHISPEFNWNIENPTQNEFIYSASSIGLNSSVLFQHFLQLAIRSRKKG